jgi:hypothetical protein
MKPLALERWNFSWKGRGLDLEIFVRCRHPFRISSIDARPPGRLANAQALWRKRNLRNNLDTTWLTSAIGLDSYGWAGNEDRCPAWTSRAVCRVGMGHLNKPQPQAATPFVAWRVVFALFSALISQRLQTRPGWKGVGSLLLRALLDETDDTIIYDFAIERMR